MSYKTLYRTYRPSSFQDVVGQEHITRTFKNALSKNKIAHAYLFTGPRGTGKTTIAKIIAKAVNCKKAPISEPCNECESCLSINTGFDSDIFEIDAASNNGVDEIREIRDKVKYAPTVGRFKVYIIDEVHMLSTGAFNALLKTLEEPPQHVIFILATTEPHKIPATIISRCQRFDFKSISIKDIINRIKFVVSAENIKIEEKAIYTIAKNADGGMRDALSLLDQAISYSDDEVTEENVHEITGTISEEKLAEIVLALTNNKADKAIQIFDKLISSGKEPLRLIENMIYYFRDLFLINKLTDIDEQLILNHSLKTQEIARLITHKKLYDVISRLNHAQYEMKKTNHPRVFIELALFEIVDIIKRTSPSFHKEQEQPIMKEVEKQAEKVVPRPVIEEKQVEEEEVDEKIIPQEDTIEKKTIDVKIIEDILNHASKEKKLNLVLQWDSLYGNDVHVAKIEQLLKDGQVEAVSNDNHIILSYEHDAICAKLYEKDIYDKALEILEQFFHEKYHILALPRRIWNDKRDEFVTQFKNKVKYPKLSPIKEVLIINKKENKYEFEPELVKEAINLFGDDIVDIK